MLTYLDTANWFDLVEQTVDTERFEKGVSAKRITPVIALAHVYEIAGRDANNRCQVAEYLDKIREIGTIRWIRRISLAEKVEAINLLLQFLGLDQSEAMIHSTNLADVTELELDANSRVELSNETVMGMVEQLVRMEDYERYRCFRDTIPLRFDFVRKARKQKRRFTTSERRDWVIGYLPNTLVLSSGKEIVVTSDIKASFKPIIDFTACPAICAALAFHEGQNVASEEGAPSDLEDYSHLVGVAYCDIAFADKRTIECLRRGKYRNLPQPNSRFESWVSGLSS